MGKRVVGALCLDCKENLLIEMEWMQKEEFIEYIMKTKCPRCGSDNWMLTDYSEI